MLKVMLAAALLLLGLGSASSAQAPPPAPPSCSGAEYRQLDFWVGDWDGAFDAGGGKIAHASNHITKDEYGACVITEHFYQPDIDYRGHSVSTYDRQGKRWRQTWVDSQGGYIALAGGPVSGQTHIFELVTLRNTDVAPFTRMIWQDVKPDSFTWRWQQRKTEADPWADNWVIHYTRKKG